MEGVFEEDSLLSEIAKDILLKEDWALHMALERAYPKAVELAEILLARSGIGFDWMWEPKISRGKPSMTTQKPFRRISAGTLQAMS